jgi:peroxiredoxin
MTNLNHRFLNRALIFGLFLLSASGLFAQKTIPTFSFQTLEGQRFSKENLEKGLPLIVFFFDPYCDHCQLQADWIVEAADDFREVQMMWVTTEMAEPTQAFKEERFGTTDLPFLHVLLDTEFMFDGYFGYSEVPSMYVYDRNGKLTKSFSKETPAGILLGFL